MSCDDVDGEWDCFCGLRKPPKRSPPRPPPRRQSVWTAFYQGLTSSTPRVELTHHTATPSSGGIAVDVNHHIPELNSLIEMLTAAAAHHPTRAQRLGQLALLIMALVRAPTWMDTAIALGQYVMGIDWLWAIVSRSVSSLIAAAKRTQTRFQNGDKPPVDEEIGWATKLIRAVWESVVLVAFRETVGSMFTSFSLAVSDFGKTLRVTTMKAMAEDMVVSLKKGLTEFARRIQSCYEAKSFKPLWGPGQDPARWGRHAAALLRHQGLITSVSASLSGPKKAEVTELVASDELPGACAEGLTMHSYHSMVRAYREAGESMTGHWDGSAAVAFRAILRDLAHKEQVVGAALQGAGRRIMPFAMYLHGPSQVGKSTLAELVYKSLGVANGYPVADQNAYTWRSGVNFQDGLNSSCWYVRMDDVDHIKGTTTPAMRVFTQDFVELVNSVPYPVEAARADEKGLIHAEPLFVSMTSNFDNEKVRAYAACPEAFWNRCHLFARVEVKEQYREIKRDDAGAPVLTPQGVPIRLDRLDKQLVLDTYDVWNVYVGEYVGPPKDDRASYFKEGKEPLNVSAFLTLARERYISHLRKQKKMLAAMLSDDFRPCCGLPTDKKCACVKKLQSGGERSDSVLSRTSSQWSATESDDEYADWQKPVVNWWVRARRRSAASARWARDGAAVTVSTAFDFLRSVSSATVGRLAYWLGWASVLLSAYLPLRLIGWLSWFAMVCATVGFGIYSSMDIAVALLSEAIEEFPWHSLVGLGAAVAAFGVLAKIVEKVYQGRGDGVSATPWVTVPEVFGPQQPPVAPRATWTREQVDAAAKRSLFPIRTGSGTAYALAITPEVMAVSTHLLKDLSVARIDLGDGEVDWFLSRDWMVPSLNNAEVTFVASRSKSSAGVLAYLPPVLDLSTVRFDEAALLGPEDRGVPSEPTAAVMPPGQHIVQMKMTTQDGDCGRPYAVRVGSSWWIAAQHYMWVYNPYRGGWATGARLTKRDALAAVQRLAPGGEVFESVRTLQALHTTPDGVPWVLRPLGPKEYSEATTAIRTGRGKGLHVLGHLVNPPHAGTPQTRMQRTPYAHVFADLEREYCGASPYWGPPVFKGEMRTTPSGPMWFSPHQTAFAASSMKSPPMDLVVVALMDYLYDVESLNFEDLRELSLAEALVGVPELWQNPVNPKTSIGLPWGGPKWKKIARSGRSVSIAPEVQVALDEMWTCLEQEAVPICAGRVTLKDEARKPGGEARVFTVIPAVVNVTMKRVLGGLLALLRANPEFFECWIGIDMTSPDVERLVNFGRAVDPSLEKVMDMDKSKMDKSWVPVMWVAVRMCFMALAWHARLSPARVARLFGMLEFVRYEWKGDLYESTQQPSGQQAVIEVNSVHESIAARIVYYSQRKDQVAKVDWRGWLTRFSESPVVPREYFEALDFRRRHAVAHFGDDNLTFTRQGTPPLLDPVAYERLLGQVATNGSKSSVLAEGPLSSCTFLKRRLIFDAELGYHLAPLEVSSLLKACVIRGPSTLSAADHAAVTLTQQLREAALHGKAFYERFQALCDEAASIAGVSSHPMYHSVPYSVLRERMFARTFSVYSDIPQTSPRTVDLEGTNLLDPFQDNCNVVFN